MSDNKYGNNVVKVMSSDVEIGYSGSETDCESNGYVGGQTGGQLWIRVYAASTISIDTAKYWYIEFQSATTDSAGAMDSPFSTSNAGGINQASGTAEPEAHMYMLHKTSGDGTAAWAAGDLITEMAVPEKMLRLLGHKYVNVMNVTDESSGATENIDVLLCVNPS